jgi:hypothetical protein
MNEFNIGDKVWFLKRKYSYVDGSYDCEMIVKGKIVGEFDKCLIVRMSWSTQTELVHPSKVSHR